MTYETPTITTLGSVQELTAQLDKIGASADAFTTLTGIDGEIQPD